MVLVFVLVVVTFFVTIYIHTNVLGSYLPKFIRQIGTQNIGMNIYCYEKC